MPQNTQIVAPSTLRRVPRELSNLGTTPGSNVVAEEFGFGPYRFTKLTLTALSVAITRTSGTVAGNSGAGKPGLIYTFPEGNVALLGGTCNLTLAAVTMADSAAGLTGIGNVQNTSTPETLAATGEASLIPSATTAIASSAGTRAASSTATAMTIIDGTTTPGELYFNYGTGNDITASGSINVTGTVTFCWIMLGDR